MEASLDRNLHDLLEAMPDAVIMMDGRGRIALANSQAERLFRRPRQQLLGEPIETLLPERFRAAHASHRDRFFAQPKTRGMGAGLELYGRRGDGEEFPVEISLSPLQTAAGPMVLSAIRDVTERKRVEASLLQASRLKSQFLANMSHELRTPLNGIIGFSELLVDGKAGPLNERQQNFLRDILNSGRHLLHLVNDLLDISRIEAGRMELHEEVFPLADAVEEACVVLAPAVEERNIAFSWAVAEDLPQVRLDRQKFKQVLLNLASNAVKFTDPGGRVTITLGRSDGNELELSVEDTGIGIAAEDIQRLFGEFERLQPENTGRRPGTGLGLALTRRLVELQAGRIEVTSTPGEGSRFTVRLPLKAMSE
ncbi:MAG TPA: ATP-binding protein [Arenimonas sp.]|uniref:sensor histidine kinase n=1 Tax=Arenimonas sp. TaxID=1872635 RepID=UPI002D7F0827|nr:ATP-binding protein [Arenimonas sp.]HEU0153248.1 ATP-binding protein [Arenimonas sp.]